MLRTAEALPLFSVGSLAPIVPTDEAKEVVEGYHVHARTAK